MPKLIINKRWILFVIIFSILIIIGVWGMKDDFGLSLAVTIIGVVGVIGYVILIPNSCRFDEKGITVYYGFGIKTVSAWSELKVIEDHHSTNVTLPWWREYHIGYFKTKFAPWQEACIPKNRKTSALIEKYYKRTVHKFG